MVQLFDTLTNCMLMNKIEPDGTAPPKGVHPASGLFPCPGSSAPSRQIFFLVQTTTQTVQCQNSLNF